jgi:hypothetical protein
MPVPAGTGLVGQVVGGGGPAPLAGPLVVQFELEFGVAVLEHGHSSRSVVVAVLDSSREGPRHAWGRSPIFGPGPPQLRVLGD